MKDLLLYLFLGAAIGITVALFMLSGPDAEHIMSMDYTRAMKVVGWLVK